MRHKTGMVSIVSTVFMIVFFTPSHTIAAQAIGIGGDPTCPYPMRSVGGTCILDPNVYIRPDSDGDGIEDTLDLCPNDARNECPAAQAMREAMYHFSEHGCEYAIGIPLIFSGVVAILGGPPTIAGFVSISSGILVFVCAD